MNLPGSPRLHVWVGLLLASVGVIVGGYAYTSWRIYHLHYLPVALGGLTLLIGGSALAGYGQANRPRLGGRGAADGPGLIERLTTTIAGLTGSEHDESSADNEPDEAEDEAGEASDASDGEPAADAADEDEDEEPGGSRPASDRVHGDEQPDRGA